MMSKAVLLSEVDKEDYWVTNGFVFKIDPNTEIYPEAFNQIRSKISTDEFAKKVLKGSYILINKEDINNYDFVKVEYYCGKVYFVYSNKKNNMEEEYILQMDFVEIEE